MADKYPLTRLSAALIELGYDSPGYRALYNAALDGRVAVTQNKAGRWFFEAEDVPAIAEGMGLSRVSQNADAA